MVKIKSGIMSEGKAVLKDMLQVGKANARFYAKLSKNVNKEVRERLMGGIKKKW